MKKKLKLQIIMDMDLYSSWVTACNRILNNSKRYFDETWTCGHEFCSECKSPHQELSKILDILEGIHD